VAVTHFKDLACWQLANELKVAVYAVVATPGVERDREFCNDVKRSARSAPSNIAEGFGRCTHREFAHFLSIARASLMETEHHLQHLHDENLVPFDEWIRMVDLAQRAQRTTSALRTYLMRTPNYRHGGAPRR
jgi:four helix bundle protein